MKHRGIRWLALVAVIALLCGVMPATYALSTPQMAEIPNLLENGDFELGNTTGWVRNAYAIDVTEEAAKDGKFGAKITSGGGEWDEYQGLYADIQVEKNTDYVFSFDHKSDAAACVIVYIFTPERERYFVSSWPTQVPGCWSKQQYYFNSGDYDVIRVQMCVGARNTVRYFDNICLSPVTKNAIGGGLASVMDTQDNRKGVAFRFDVAAQVKVEEPNAFVSGTIDPYGTGAQYELVRMGAVVTNKAMDTEELTLEAVDGKRCIDIAAKNVLEVTADTVSYAVRVTNVPEYAENQFISARPYCIYRDGASEYVLYGSAAYTESCNSITTRHESAVFTPGDEWKLIWNDEFGGTAVDETKWYGELMVDDGNYYATNREENLSVRDGNMVLTVLDEPIGNSRFTGSRVNTGHNFSFLYGRLEFRAKLSWGKGVASALWTLGDYYLYNGVGNGWPYGGEIDIMELVGDSNTDPFSKENMTTTHNIHWGYDYSQHYEVGSYKLGGYNNCYKFPDGISPSGEYHIYAVEWDYRQFKFYVDDVFQMEIRWGTDSDGWDYLAWYDKDGKQLGKVFRLPAFDDNGNYRYTDVSCADLDFAFANEENPHFLIMNNLMCGWNANQDTNGGNLPQSMYVDYVRVYQKVKDE